MLALTSHGSSAVEHERSRVAAHLLHAERLCRDRVPIDAAPSARLLRALLLDELAAYREEGRFPRHDAKGVETPVFVDARGTHCAVGHLLRVTGEHAMVERIAASRNLARVHELADEPGLSSWLDAVALDIDEAARIQPTYCSTPATILCGECRWGNYPGPAPGVVEGHVVGYWKPTLARVEIDVIHGASANLIVGYQVDVSLLNSETNPVPIGTRVVALLPTSITEDAGPAGFVAPVQGLVVSLDGRTGCGDGDPSVSVDAYVTARMSGDCVGSLGSLGRAWSRDNCDSMRCGTGSPPSRSVDLLLVAVPVLVGLAIARRRARRRPRR